MQPYNSTDIDTAWKTYHNILSGISDFHRVINLLIAVRALSMHLLMLLSVDEILLPRYVNWCTNFRGLPFQEEIALSWLKHMNSVLSEFTWRPMSLAGCSSVCSRDLAGTGVFARSTWLSAYFTIIYVY